MTDIRQAVQTPAKITKVGWVCENPVGVTDIRQAVQTPANKNENQFSPVGTTEIRQAVKRSETPADKNNQNPNKAP